MKKLIRYGALLAAVLIAAAVYGAVTRNDAFPPEGSSAGLGLMLLEKDGGLYVLAVTEDSLADRADIHPGDYLLQAGEESLQTTGQLDALIDSCPGGLEMLLRRGEQIITVRMPAR